MTVFLSRANRGQEGKTVWQSVKETPNQSHDRKERQTQYTRLSTIVRSPPPPPFFPRSKDPTVLDLHLRTIAKTTTSRALKLTQVKNAEDNGKVRHILPRFTSGVTSVLPVIILYVA